VVVVATAKGRPAWARGEVGWVLACHGGLQQACVEGGGCPAPLKMKEERKGNDLSGALGWRCSCGVELAPTGYRLCEGEARWMGRS